jgi:hypothetical protein
MKLGNTPSFGNRRQWAEQNCQIIKEDNDDDNDEQAQ